MMTCISRISMMTFSITFLIVGSFPAQGLGQDLPDKHWPRWRGPAAQGSTSTGTYAAKWTTTENLAWKVKLPGFGCSTPIVWGNNIVITSPIDGNDAVMNFDWNGKLLWKTKVGKERKGSRRSSGSNPSAATDGKNIFVYYKSGNLAALDWKGKLLWSDNLQKRYGKDTLYHDLGTSPVLSKKNVIVAVMDTGKGVLAAFDKKTGRLAWKVDRFFKTPREGDHSYASPIVMEYKGKELMLVWGAEHLTAHDVTDGKVLWTCGEFGQAGKANWVIVGSPVIVGDIAVVSYGRGARLAGVKLGGTGDVTKTHRVWHRTDTGAFCPTPAAYDGKVYLLGDSGKIECIDPKTGKTLWSGALPKNRNKYYSSPTIADGKLYATREDGVVFVVGIKNKFELLSENPLGERMKASPVPVANRLLLRSEKHLYCVGANSK
jgi:outer membrane protein assembly factor BamB